MDFSIYSDEELIKMYKTGNLMVVDFLCAKYKPLVLKNAQTLFIEGGEMDDLIQEGMIGIFKAIGGFDINEQASFYKFANICIRRRMINAIEAANRQKHKPLSKYEDIFGDGVEINDGERFANIAKDPARIVEEKEDISDTIESIMVLLSPKEKSVFELYICGYEYKEIAEELGFTPKVVDNCLSRIKAKARGITFYTI